LLFPLLALLREGSGVGGWRSRLAPWSLGLNILLCTTLIVVANIDDQRAIPWAAAFLVTANLDWWLFRREGFGHPLIRRVWKFYAVLMLMVLVIAYGVDLGCYSYLHTRLSGSLLQFLDTPLVSLQMMWQSYPVLRGFIALAVLVALLWRGLSRLEVLDAKAGPKRAWRVIQGFMATGLILFLIWGRVSDRPLRWGAAYSLGDSFQTHLSLNPILFFLETMVDPSATADLKEVKATGPLLAQYLGCEYQEGSQGPRLWRKTSSDHLLPEGARPNVVLIHLESFAAHKTGILGNPLNPTPHFDQLAREGLFFDRFYAPAENTSRAILALLFGLIDLSPGASNTASRNPRLVDQRTLVNALQGYSKHYFLGGTADWAQIRATLKHNIQGLQVKEQGDFKSPSVDVWGVSDADMLRESDGFLRTAQEPFFALLQTAGNHPPYTIPGHLGFQVDRPVAAQLQAGSFENLDEYQALRLMDWSLGRFFDEAKTSPWFKNTIFVLYGDHGVARGNRDKRYGDLTLASHHVPLVIYAPGLLQPRRIHTTCSQVDLMPTLLGLLGVVAENRTLGRDALDPTSADRGVAFTFTPFLTPPAIGLLRGDAYLNLNPDGTPHLYDLKDPAGRDVSGEHPDDVKEMTNLARAIRVWSNYLIHHNRP
jgi:hypothetical protein